MDTSSNRTKARSRGETLESLEYEITCPVCHDHFVDPKILPCCHYYCKRCVHALVDTVGPGKPISCPECRRKTMLTSEDVEQLVTVSIVRQLVEVMNDVVLGDDSQIGETEIVRSSPVVIKRNPRVTSTKARASICDSRFCAQHDILMKFFCFTCKAPVCSECFLSSHENHPYEYVSAVANMFRESIQEWADSLKELKDTFERAQEQIGTRTVEIERQSDLTASKIAEGFEDLSSCARRREAELTRTLAELAESKLKVIAEQKNTLGSTACGLANYLDAASTVLTSPSNDYLVVATHQTLLEEGSYQRERCANLTLEPTEVPNICASLPNVDDIVNACVSRSEVYLSEVFGPGLGTVELGKWVCFSVVPIVPLVKNSSVRVSMTALLDGGDVKISTTELPAGGIEATYRPTTRGWHRLCVDVGGSPAEGSPFSVLVTLPLTRLKRPVGKIVGVNCSHGMAFNHKGMMVVAELGANRVTIRDRDGMNAIELEGHRFNHPWGVTTDKEDNIYVSEEGAHCITKLTRDGKFVASAAGQGDQGGQLNGPRGLRMIDGKLYVTERNNSRVQVFDPVSLQPLEVLSENMPFLTTDVAASPLGYLFVSGTGSSAVKVLSLKTHALLRSIEHTDLQQPAGLFYDVHQDLLHVADPGSGSVLLFRSDGTFVAKFCDTVAETGLLLPWNVAVDSNGFVHVSDTSNGQILVF